MYRHRRQHDGAGRAVLQLRRRDADGQGYWRNSSSDTILRGDTDDDATAEFAVEIKDGASVQAALYSAADFIV